MVRFVNDNECNTVGKIGQARWYVIHHRYVNALREQFHRFIWKVRSAAVDRTLQFASGLFNQKPTMRNP